MSNVAAAIEPVVHVKTPEIEPQTVVVNYNGQVFREVFARLPKGAIADDLKSPGLWKKVQQSQAKALRRFDRLLITDFDETWVAEAIVADANREGVTLAKPRITVFPDRYDRLLETEDFRIAWVGTGYQVQRKSDAAMVTPVTHSKQLAERDLINMTPRRG